MSAPWGAAVNAAGQIYVADTGNNRVQRFDSSGKYQRAFGGLGSLAGQMNTPTGIAVSATGNVYVGDNNNHRIERFDGNGLFQQAFGGLGHAGGQFTHPNGIAVSPTGEIFITNGANNRVEKFLDPTEWVSEFKTPRSRAKWASRKVTSTAAWQKTWQKKTAEECQIVQEIAGGQLVRDSRNRGKTPSFCRLVTHPS